MNKLLLFESTRYGESVTLTVPRVQGKFTVNMALVWHRYLNKWEWSCVYVSITLNHVTTCISAELL